MIPIAIVLHHTSGNEKSAAALRAVFKEKYGVSYIGYHYAIAPNGNVWKDLTDEQVGAHNNKGKFNNTNSLGIAFVGDFTNKEPSVAQMEKAKKIIRAVTKKYPIKQIVGHRDNKATACPGNKLYAKLGELRKALEPEGVPMDPLDSIIIPRDTVRTFYQHVRGENPEPEADIDRPLRFLIDLLTEAKNRGIAEGQTVGGTPPTSREVTLLELLQQTKVKIV